MTSRRTDRQKGPSTLGVGCLLAMLAAGCAEEVAHSGNGPGATAASAPAVLPAAVGDGVSSTPSAGTAVPTSENEKESVTWADVPVAMRPCLTCHRDTVISYLNHGMFGSIGPAGKPEPGVVENPTSGNRYELRTASDGAWLETTLADGGIRTQRIVGRIGAGVLDVSWVTAEVDPKTGEDTDRLFFAPVETITGHGLELSPFDIAGEQAGPDFALSEGCLTCHTTDRLELLPNASTAVAAKEGRASEVYPANALGSNAFEQLQTLTCDTCHGDSRRHVDAMTSPGPRGRDIGIARLAELPAATQRDVCARCHLQGDARIDLVRGHPDRDKPLAGQIPMLVPTQPDKDYRFVSQIERLALSACFRSTPEMTCTTCHLPHDSAAAQGVARFDSACATCHDLCSRPEGLAVDEVTGEPARSQDGCVDCHVRRSQPIDLPHVRSADHFIRRTIERPEVLPHRQFPDHQGPLELYDDGRLAQVLATRAGKRWRSGALAMGLMTMGRIEEAKSHFSAFPAPGSAEALKPSSPDGLTPFETFPSFHQMRALALMASGDFEPALAAFSDALELDPLLAGARLGRAQLRFDLRDVAGALEDSQAVIDAYPEAEQPWGFRARMAERLRRPDLATTAFEAYVLNWPSDPEVWTKLGLLRRQRGDEAGALEALEQARMLSPSFTLAGAE